MTHKELEKEFIKLTSDFTPPQEKPYVVIESILYEYDDFNWITITGRYGYTNYYQQFKLTCDLKQENNIEFLKGMFYQILSERSKNDEGE